MARKATASKKQSKKTAKTTKASKTAAHGRAKAPLAALSKHKSAVAAKATSRRAA